MGIGLKIGAVSCNVSPCHHQARLDDPQARTPEHLFALVDTFARCRIRLDTVVVLVVSASAVAEPASSSDMLVVVLQTQNGTRETHSQPIAADNCSLMLRLLKELNEKGQSIMLNLGAPTQLMLKLFKGLCWHMT